MPSEITLLLHAHRDGDDGALDRLATLLYPQLKSMARRRSKDSAGMGATTLVNETFLKMLAGGELRTEDRKQFFGLAATIMRRIIVDEIRYVTAEKRDGQEVTLMETVVGDDAHTKAEFLLQVNSMLDVLQREDERLARIFECRYFAGLTSAESAEVMDVSERSAERLWSAARTRISELIDESRE